MSTIKADTAPRAQVNQVAISCIGRTLRAARIIAATPTSAHRPPEDSTPAAPKRHVAQMSCSRRCGVVKPETIDALVELRKKRDALINMRNRVDNGTAAQVRRMLGYSTQLPESEREKIVKQAQRVIAEARGKTKSAPPSKIESPKLGDGVRDFVLIGDAVSDVFESPISTYEKEMAKLAKTLHVHDWWCSNVGLGVQSLATIIGHAGDVSRFRSPSALWMRFGVGVVDGTAQGRPGAGATAEEWTRRGYSKNRRSALWVVGGCIMRSAAIDGSDSVYRSIYNTRQVAEVAKEGMTKGHAHARAMRYMVKALLVDLWRVWNGMEPRAVHASQPENTVAGPSVPAIKKGRKKSAKKEVVK